MRTSFDIYHVRRDGSELKIASAGSRSEIAFHVDNAQYTGTWISDTVKVLRFKRGEIHIRRVHHPIAIISSRYIVQYGEQKVKLRVVNSDIISSILVSRTYVETYDSRNNLLEVYYSFAEMAERVEKEIAFECREWYEKLCATYNLVGIM